jgi:predicted phage tail protein
MSQIRGAGGAPDEPRAPQESPDSLVSIAYARIVDLVSEGEIFGLVNGLESIYLDGTPIESDGITNIRGVSYEARNGTQDQTYLPGFPAVESEVVQNHLVETTTPFVYLVTDLNLSAVRLNFSVPIMLTQNKENGDKTGSLVVYAIDLKHGSGSYVTIKNASFNGKTTSGYERSERVDLSGAPVGGWTIRVRRITAEPENGPESPYIKQNDIYIKSTTDIIDSKFRYPNSALVGIQFDAKTFDGKIPTRAYDLKLRIIRVPSNYDPETREYTGIWDGTFQLAWSDNPAWVYYDLLLNTRFGLGNRINASQIDKWGLYQIAQYCDALVDDGKGGMEPRFTCNLYLQQAQDAYRVLQDISSIFKGITYWGGGQAYVSADMPSDPVYTYTNANVIGGKFGYKGAKLSTRYSVALVTWNDPLDFYKAKTEYVEDRQAITRFGVRTLQIGAFGCTSQGQAIRAGKWALLTNQLETESISFGVGLDGIRARPGQVVKIADNDRAGRRIGGRITAATINSVTVDKVGTVAAGDEITVMLPDGTAQTRTIESILEKTIYVEIDFTAIPLRMSVFAIDSEELKTQLFRLVSISESGGLEYTISAIKHVPDKYSAVESGTIISARPITAVPSSAQAPVTNVEVTSTYKTDQYAAVSQMIVTWDLAVGAIGYEVEWQRDNGDWVYAGQSYITEKEVQGIFSGSYYVRVRALNSAGIASAWTTAGPFALTGKPENTAELVNLRTESEIFAIRVLWDIPVTASDAAYVELVYNTTNSDVGAEGLSQVAYPTLQYLHSGMGAAITLWFKGRIIDKTGNIGPWSDWVSGISSADADEILEYLVGQITETELGEDLLAEIEKISGSGPGSVNERISAVAEAIAEVDEKVDDLEASTDASIAILQDQINNIAEAPDWDSGVAYLAGSLVNYDGRLYSAKIDVPAGTPTSNTTYWEDIGAFSSLGEAVASLTVRMDTAETDIDDLTGIAVATTSSIEAMRSAFRDDNGDGELADALQGASSQALFAQEVTTRATENEASAIRTTLLEARTTTAESRIVTIESTVVANDVAITMRVDLLTADVGTNSALIAAESIARADADTALSSQLTALTATVGTNTAAISTEATTRANADSALSTQIGLVSAVADSKNKTYRQTTAPASGMIDGDLWFDSDDNNKSYRYSGGAWVATDDTRIATNTAAILTEQTARADADTALASSITTVAATANAKNKTYRQNDAPSSGMTSGDIWFDENDNNKSYRYSGSAWVATDDTRIAANAAAITTEATARADADTALASTITSVGAVANAKNKTYRQTTAPASGMDAGDLWFDSDDNNKSYRYSGSAWVATDDTRIATNTAAIVTEQTARADADTALAGTISTVSAVANSKNKTFSQTTAPASGMISGDIWFDTDDNNKSYRYSGSAWVAADDARIAANTAAISTEATTRASADTALSSSITTLSSTVGSNTAAISTNASALATLDGDLSAMYSIKVGLTLGGQQYAVGMGLGIENTPAGMQSNVIFLADKFSILHSASSGSAVAPFIVTGGQVIINNAVIGNATISFAKITDTLQSDNYVANTSGWRIAKNGFAELQGVKVRGDVEATTINASAVNIIDTLMIKGEAVNATVYEVVTGPVGNGALTTEQVLAEIEITSTGQPIAINWSFSFTDGSPGYATVRIRHGDLVSGPITLLVGTNHARPAASSVPASASGTFVHLDPPINVGATKTTYSLTAQLSSANLVFPGVGKDIFMSAVQIKR